MNEDPVIGRRKDGQESFDSMLDNAIKPKMKTATFYCDKCKREITSDPFLTNPPEGINQLPDAKLIAEAKKIHEAWHKSSDDLSEQ